MSRPYQHNPLANQYPANHQAAHLSSRPIASTQPDGTPTSYKTNVNRAKTQRWVEAKSYSYDGDDWGDADDYEEYGGYDEPVQAKPTGLRQQGQSVSSGNASRYNAVNRSNSFDQGDEGQAFSAGGPQQYGNPDAYDREQNQAVQPQRVTQYVNEQSQQQQPYPSKPSEGSVQSMETMESQMAAGHTYPPPANYRGVSYPDQPRQPGNGSRSQSITSNTSSLDFHGRRDFTPSAVPPPLHTRASPAPRDSSEFIPPPRKSSLSQPKLRHMPTSNDNAPIAHGQALYTKDTATSPTRDLEESSPSKALPFVRPADIYRRMQEEREKERKSQDSSRPSTNAVMIEQTPVPDSKGTSDGDSSREDSSRALPLGPRASFETDNSDLGTRRLDPSLQPVAERKGEYGMESVTGGPVLPDVTRISGFGESFLNTMGNDVIEPHGSDLPSINGPQASIVPIHQNTEDPSLRNQPSLGFRSVVHQAFDTPNDQIPQTPSSLSGSAVVRSNSESTNGISPIISRAPSTTSAEVRAREAEAREANIPRIAEEPSEAVSRPTSSNTPGTPKSVTRKAHLSESPRHASTASAPKSFIPGHRRDISTPSPDNSPARTPALEANSQLRQPEEAELAVTTPIERNMPASSFPRDAVSFDGQQPSRSNDIYRDGQPPPAKSSSPVNKSSTPVRIPDRIDVVLNATQEPASSSRTFNQLGSPVTFDSPTGRAESPSKSKVRDLAGKFEGVAVSRHGSEQSLPFPISMSGSPPKLEDPFISRPGNDRMQSFRPHLPGGWESYASTAPVKQGFPKINEEITSTKNLTRSDGAKLESPDLSHMPNEDIDITPTTVKRTLSKSHQGEESENPFSAVATAGSALAGALVAAMGMNQDEPATPSEDFNRPRGRSASSKDTEVHPEASRPWVAPFDDSTSSVEPTPLAKDTPQSLGQSPTSNPDYFPPVIPLRAKPRNIMTQGDDSARPIRPQFLPSLSTDPSPQDYESDRLRKEIVRELSPHAEHFEDDQIYNTSASQASAPRLSVNPTIRGHGHDSIALPSEYESYWNGSTSGDESSRPISEQVVDSSIGTQVPGPPIKNSKMAGQISNEIEPTSGSSNHLEVRPTALVHRFSWEPEPEEINTPQQPTSLQATEDTLSEYQSQVVSETPLNPVIDSPNHNENLPIKSSQALGVSSVEEALYGPLPPAPIEEAIRRPVSQHSETRPHSSRSATPGGNGHLPAEDRYNIWPSAHQENDQIQGNITIDNPNDSTELPLQPLSQTIQTKIPAFREILALGTPQERIQAYNATREQFANMNTGLENWITATVNDLPEHAALINNGGQFVASAYGHKPSSSRGKLAGIRLSSLQPLQQPYYQQYLNASSQPPSSSPAAGAPTTPGHVSNHPHSGGSGGKLSSHQVQAKGKDLLQSAGKFGGKANVAAKGLFSKGKNKFRSAGGGDKTSISSSSNPDASHRGMRATSQGPPQVEFESQRASRPIQPEPTHHESVPNLQSVSSSRLSGYLPQSRPVSSMIPDDQAAAIQDKSNPLPPLPLDEVQDSPRPSAANTRPRSLGQSNIILNDTEFGRSLLAHEPEPAVIGDSPPIFLKETPSAESYVGTARTQCLLSASGSNRTPNQSSFGRSQWLSEIMPPRSSTEPPIPQTSGLPEAIYGTKSLPETLTNIRRAMGEDLGTASESPGESFPTHSSEKNLNQVYREEASQSQTRGDYTSANRATSPRLSEDSEGTYQTADSGQDPILQGTEPSTPKAPNAPVQLVPASSSSTQDVSPLKHMPQRRSDTFNRHSTQYQLRPFSFTEHNKTPPVEQSEHRSYRGPSLDNTSIITSRDRPPSPVSPQRPDFVQASQTAPVNYDTNHGFRPESTQEFTTGPRPGSFSRPFQDPNLHDHPAFRQQSFRNPAESSDLPLQYYQPSLRDETMIPRQQNTEYSLEGVGPPADETNVKSRSRRGSRSSGFFKRLSRPPSAEIFALPMDVDHRDVVRPVKTPVNGEKRKRRASLFRTLTGRSGSDSGRSKERELPLPSRSRTDIHPTSNNSSLGPGEQSGTLLGKEVSVKTRTKLQRSSTSGTAGQEGANKKRFSGIGSLFSRSSRRQSSLEMSEPQSTYSSTPSEQGAPYGQRQSSHRNLDQLRPPRQDSLYFASHQVPSAPPPGYLQRLPDHVYDRPPLEGYYSPDRRSGTEDTFSPDNFTRQPSPQPISQYQGPSGQYYNEQPPRPRSSTWNRLLNTKNRDLAPQFSNDTSQYSTPNSHPVRGSSRGPNFSQGDQTRYPNNQGHDVGLPSHLETSSWIRSSDRRANNSSSILPPVSTLPSVNSDPAQASSRGPLRSSMKKPRGYHEIDGNPTGRAESPPPPPPPPKDDWLTQPTHHAGPSQLRSSSFNSLPSTTYPTPVINSYRQSLPLLQTNMNCSRNIPQEGKSATLEEIRRSRQRGIESGEMPSRHKSEVPKGSNMPLGTDGEERIVMSSSSYPGQEWQPDYGNYEWH
ncbi:MAG: hypothetical protein Q9187_003499 [Circinaria calcarea]